MLPSIGTSSLLAATDNSSDLFSPAGMLSSLSKEEQEVLNSDRFTRRFSDVSFSRLVARRLSGCSNGMSDGYACGSGLTMSDMMSATGRASLERLTAERRMSSISLQDGMSIENASRRRCSSSSLQNDMLGDQFPEHLRRKSLEFAAIAGRRRSSLSQQSDFSQTSQRILDYAKVENATRTNSLDLLSDVVALASANSPMSTDVVTANNVDGGSGISANHTASTSPNRTSLDLLAGEASILSSDMRRSSGLSQHLDSYEHKKGSELFDDISMHQSTRINLLRKQIQQQDQNRAFSNASNFQISYSQQNTASAMRESYYLASGKDLTARAYEMTQLNNKVSNHGSLQRASFLVGSQKHDGGNSMASESIPNHNEASILSRLPMPQSPRNLSMEVFHQSMQNSEISQRNIQSWDRKMGLKKSHCSTMTKTTQSRKRLKFFFGNLLGYSTKTEKVEGRKASRKKRKTGAKNKK